MVTPTTSRALTPDKLRIRRKALGLTQTSVAAMAGISKFTVAAAERTSDGVANRTRRLMDEVLAAFEQEEPPQRARATPVPFPERPGVAASCTYHDPQLWDGGGDETSAAMKICGRCPLEAECLAYAIAYDVSGTWGSTTYTHRVAYRRRLGIIPIPVDYRPGAAHRRR